MEPSHKQWIIPFAVQLIPAGCLLIGAFWMPESPRWCLTKGKREQALKDLCWIRNLPQDHTYIMEELEAIDAQVEHDRLTVGPGFWKPFLALKQRKVQYRIFLGGMLFLWQNGSGKHVYIRVVKAKTNFLGINAINYYSPTVFKSLGVTEGFLTTGIFGVVKCVLTFVWLIWLIDRLGRTKLLMFGALGKSTIYETHAKHTLTRQLHQAALCACGISLPISRSPIQRTTRTLQENSPPAVSAQSSSSTSGPLSIHPRGTVHHGSSTPRCTASRPALWVRRSPRQITGSGTSSSLDSLPRCSAQWATEYTCSSHASCCSLFLSCKHLSVIPSRTYANIVQLLLDPRDKGHPA
jgi:hypothetical protein